MKICTTCKIEKDLTEFSKKSESKDGYQPKCKQCTTEYHSDYRSKNLDKLKDKATRYNKQKRKQKSDYQRTYRERMGQSEEWVKKCIYNNKRRNTKHDGVLFTLKFEDIIWPTHCPYLNIPLDYTHRNGCNYRSVSFDKTDPDQEYTPDNVEIVSMMYNNLKGRLSHEEVDKIIFNSNLGKGEYNDN